MEQLNKITLTIIGLPGSGKGTQAKILAKRFRLTHIELGNLIRKLVKKDQQAKKRYNQGIPQPNGLIEKILDEKIAQLVRQPADRRLIIEPFPLTVGQIKILDRLVKKHRLAKPIVIHLETDPRAMMKRMMARKEGRKDDSPETAKKRIDAYQKTLAPVLGKLRQKNQLLEVDANPSISKVAKDIEKILLSKVNL
jgi:adenylate kinase